MAYTDEGQIEKYLGTELPESLDTQLASWITAITEWIDKYVGFSFENDTASDKYFDALGGRDLLVDKYHDDLVSIITLDVDGDSDVTLDLDYVKEYPLNEDAKDCLKILPAGSISLWPNRDYSVKINAKWGYSKLPPEEIKLCATRLITHLLNTRLKGSDNVSAESLGDYSISYGDIDEAADVLGITNILDQYRNLAL